MTVKTAALSIRIDEELKDALERAAGADDRTVSQYVVRALVTHLKQAGFWPPKQRHKVSAAPATLR